MSCPAMRCPVQRMASPKAGDGWIFTQNHFVREPTPVDLCRDLSGIPTEQGGYRVGSGLLCDSCPHREVFTTFHEVAFRPPIQV